MVGSTSDMLLSSSDLQMVSQLACTPAFEKAIHIASIGVMPATRRCPPFSSSATYFCRSAVAYPRIDQSALQNLGSHAEGVLLGEVKEVDEREPLFRRVAHVRQVALDVVPLDVALRAEDTAVQIPHVLHPNFHYKLMLNLVQPNHGCTTNARDATTRRRAPPDFQLMDPDSQKGMSRFATSTMALVTPSLVYIYTRALECERHYGKRVSQGLHATARTS